EALVGRGVLVEEPDIAFGSDVNLDALADVEAGAELTDALDGFVAQADGIGRFVAVLIDLGFEVASGGGEGRLVFGVAGLSGANGLAAFEVGELRVLIRE